MSSRRFKVRLPRLSRTQTVLLLGGCVALVVTLTLGATRLMPLHATAAGLETQVKDLAAERDKLAKQVAENRAASGLPAQSHSHSHAAGESHTHKESATPEEPGRILADKILEAEAVFGNKAFELEILEVIAKVAQQSGIESLSYEKTAKSRRSRRQQDAVAVTTVKRMGENGKAADEQITRSQVVMNVTAPYRAIAEFITSVDTLGYPVAVSNFQIRKAKNMDDLVRGNLTLVIYTKSRTQNTTK